MPRPPDLKLPGSFHLKKKRGSGRSRISQVGDEVGRKVELGVNFTRGAQTYNLAISLSQITQVKICLSADIKKMPLYLIWKVYTLNHFLH